MIALLRILALLFFDLIRSLVCCLSTNLCWLKNLLLRCQLAQYKERGIKSKSVDAPTRVVLAVLSRFDWNCALVVVRPETVVRWHLAGWRLFWHWKCRSGRPPISLELRQLIGVWPKPIPCGARDYALAPDECCNMGWGKIERS